MIEQRALLHRYWYHRVMLNFAVDEVRLASRLPDGWRPGARLGGSNLTVGFCEVTLDVDARGTPLNVSRYLYVPVNGNAQREGETVNMRYVTFADRPEALGGCAVVACSAEHTQSITTGEELVVNERYRFHRGPHDLELELSYERSPLTSIAAEMVVRCPNDPSYRRVYQNEEIRSIVRRTDQAIDRTTSLRYRIASPALADLFDGSERLVSVVAVPTSVRSVYQD